MKTERTFVRVCSVEHEPLLPMSAERAVDKIKSFYSTWAKGCGGGGSLIFTIDRIPKSLNHQYIRRGKGRQYDLEQEIKDLRDLLFVKLAPVRAGAFRPVGVLAAVIEFHSPRWVTKENTVRDVDIDNKVKPLLDALEKATGIRDSRFWSVNAVKVLSGNEYTEICIYDLGDIVERR